MPVLRLALMAVTSVTLVLGVCESDDGGEVSESRALELAVIFAGDNINDVPYTGDYFDCTINIGRQPAAPASPLRAVHGRCLWDVKPQGSSWLVTFRETWFCSDWSAIAAGYPPCDGINGFHEWEYFVDLDANTVELLDDTGQFAPDM